jgi:pimeloyl-ACP methyl ester carboxylesterase
MGASVAMRFAIDHPGRTLGLVLMGAFPALRDNRGIRELWDSTVSTMRDPVRDDFVRDFQTSTLAGPVAPALLESVVGESLKVPARVWRATFEDFVESDFAHEIGRISAPTLAAWGDRDSFVSVGERKAVGAAIPRSRVVVYRGAGHGFHWENPALFSAHLIAFAREILFRAGRPAFAERWRATA